MAFYFINALTGDDQAPGTVGAPWRSMSRIEQQQLQPGDQVLFARGKSQEWRHILRTKNGSEGYPIIYGAYGEGDRPRITTSQWCNCPIIWSEISTNIWEASLTFLTHQNVGFFFENETIYARRVAEESELSEDMDFWIRDPRGDPKVEVYCEGNPALVHPALQIAPGITGVMLGDNAHDVVIQDLEIHHTGGHGVDLKTGGLRLSIQRCHIHHCGGRGYKSADAPGGWVREGEPINFQGTAQAVEITDNLLENGYDAVIGIQGFKAVPDRRDIWIARNTIRRGQYGVAVWQSTTGSSTDGIRIFSNVIEETGYGLNPDYRGGSAGIKGFHYTPPVAYVLILNNTFRNWREGGAAVEMSGQAYGVSGIDVAMDYNHFEAAPDQLTWVSRAGNGRDEYPKFTASEKAEWTALTGWDSHSEIKSV